MVRPPETESSLPTDLVTVRAAEELGPEPPAHVSTDGTYETVYQYPDG